jgi:hypothetical protein
MFSSSVGSRPNTSMISRSRRSLAMTVAVVSVSDIIILLLLLLMLLVVVVVLLPSLQFFVVSFVCLFPKVDVLSFIVTTVTIDVEEVVNNSYR